MNIIFFFFTLFQNFMIPLDSSWWDLFKSALAPQFTICPPVCFGTYLWIIFNFTSVPRIDRRRGAKKSENGGGMNIKFFFSRCFKISWYHWIALDEIYSNLPLLPSLRFCSPVCLALISEFFLFLLVFPYWKKVVVGRIKFFHEISSLPENIGSDHPLAS